MRPDKPLCTICQSPWHYQSFCAQKKRKVISKRGKHAEKWQTFRDEVAIPYLDKNFGHVCSVPGCSETENLDVDHIKNRGSHSSLRYDVSNLQYLCRPHHRLKTDGKLVA